MIQLHCGWPKTGTTSLQRALVEHQDRLAQAGVVYPREWRQEVDGSHNGLERVLGDLHGSDTALDEVHAVLRAHAGEDLLLSSERIAVWLLLRPGDRVFLRLLAAMREVAPVRCIWTLRRFDDWAQSIYLGRVANGHELPPPDQFMGNLRPAHLFSGMLEVEEALDGNVAYVEYSAAGTHNEELLRAFGLPPEVAVPIGRQLSTAARLNVGLEHRQIVALVNRKALSERCGLVLEPEPLLAAFRRGFRFAGDHPCVLVDPGARRDLHHRMLESAAETGFEPYVRFFADDEIGDDTPPASLDPDCLGDDDLDGLVEFLRHLAEDDPVQGTLEVPMRSSTGVNGEGTHRRRVEGKLRAFIAEELLDGELDAGTDPLATDAVDSLGLEQLVDYIEREFSVSIEDQELARRNFSSLAVLAAFVESKQRQPAR
jgi:acyl carrier protein